jgi:hypothetical protein
MGGPAETAHRCTQLNGAVLFFDGVALSGQASGTCTCRMLYLMASRAGDSFSCSMPKWLPDRLSVDADGAEHEPQVAGTDQRAGYFYIPTLRPWRSPWQLGLRQPQVSRFETGQPVRDLDTLTYWARVLRVPSELLWFRLPKDMRQLAATKPVGSDLALSTSRGVRELPSLWWASDLDEARQYAVALWDYSLEDGRRSGAVDTTH